MKKVSVLTEEESKRQVLKRHIGLSDSSNVAGEKLIQIEQISFQTPKVPRITHKSFELD